MFRRTSSAKVANKAAACVRDRVGGVGYWCEGGIGSGEWGVGVKEGSDRGRGLLVCVRDRIGGEV